MRCIKLQFYKSYMEIRSKKAQKPRWERRLRLVFVSCCLFFLIMGTIDTLKCHEDCLKVNVDSTKLLSENKVCSSKHGTSSERVFICRTLVTISLMDFQSLQVGDLKAAVLDGAFQINKR